MMSCTAAPSQKSPSVSHDDVVWFPLSLTHMKLIRNYAKYMHCSLSRRRTFHMGGLIRACNEAVAMTL